MIRGTGPILKECDDKTLRNVIDSLTQGSSSMKVLTILEEKDKERKLRYLDSQGCCSDSKWIDDMLSTSCGTSTVKEKLLSLEGKTEDDQEKILREIMIAGELNMKEKM